MGWVNGVSLHLKKAFEKVPYKRLENIKGLKGTSLKWITSFVIYREMRTVIKGRKLSRGKVICGVQKESVLAPVMLAINVDDVQKAISGSRCCHTHSGQG